MPMSPEDRDRMLEHLKQFLDAQQPCPVCTTNSWALEGPFFPAVVGQVAMGYAFGQPAPPVVLAICSRCFYIRQFAWTPIQKGMKELQKAEPDRG